MCIRDSYIACSVDNADHECSRECVALKRVDEKGNNNVTMNEKISLYERRRRLITTLHERQNDTVGNLLLSFL